MAGRSLPPTRGRATYLACVVRHTSTCSVGWIAAHVVHVAAAERAGRAEGCVRGQREAALVGWRWVCVVPHRLLRATGCSIRRQCSHRRCSTVRGGRTDAGGGKGLAERGSHAHSSHHCCLTNVADRLSTVSALTAIYNALAPCALTDVRVRAVGALTPHTTGDA